MVIVRSRSEIKWEPFDSLFGSKEVLKALERKKNYQEKPTLSPDELENLNLKITEALHTKTPIKITYYYQGYIYKKIGIILNIQKQDFKIYFEDYTSLYFEQILKVDIL